MTASECEISFGDDENVLELESGDRKTLSFLQPTELLNT